MDKLHLTDKVLEILRQANSTIQLNELSKLLHIKSNEDDYFLLREILDELVQSKLITKSAKRKYSLKEIPTNKYQGLIEISGDVGILKTNEKHPQKIIIRRRNFNTALDGDEVVVKLLAQREKKKLRGEVIKIINRSKIVFFGTIEFDGDFFFLVPDDSKYYVDFLVPRKYLKDAKIGDKVSARILHWDEPSKSPVAEIIDVLGRTGNPEAEFNSIVKDFNLITEFPNEVLQEITKIRPPQNRVYKSRRDFRNEDVITIDPEDAKDFDDALSLKKLENGNFLLGIHIADVSYYVNENSNVDIEARYRGTSVYLVDRVIPMLPEKLSNEICSLQPDKPRYAFSVIVEITENAEVINYDIVESIITNKRRFNYNEVKNIIDTQKGDLVDLILALYKLSVQLRKKRFEEGGINFSTVEYKFILDAEKFPVQVIEKEATAATQLVEEFMLLANKIVAQHIKTLAQKHNKKFTLPFIYRTHDIPDNEKLKEVLQFIKSSTGTNVHLRNISSKQLNQFLTDIKGKVGEDTVNHLLIRAMAKAEYSEKNIGHYGLGFKDYTHFTSPIRRYPDLLVHRLLKEYSNSKLTDDRIKLLKLLVKDAAKNSTMREIQAMEAERASNKVALLFLTDKNIGEVFDGTVTGVTTWGIYVKLNKIHSEGLVRIRDMMDDYYIFDEKNFCLVGKRTRKKFGFGANIQVRIAKVDFEKRQIELIHEG